MPARLKEKSRSLCLIALTEPGGKVLKTRASFKQRLKVGSNYITVYDLREEDIESVRSGQCRAYLLERVSKSEGYVDQLTSRLVPYQLGSWCLTPASEG